MRRIRYHVRLPRTAGEFRLRSVTPALRRFLELSDKVAQNDERLLTLALKHLKLLWDICPVHTGLPSYVFWDSRPLARARRLDVY